MKWYYSDAGQQGGPIEDADFQELVRKGIVRDDTPVWREGMGAWAPYGTVKPAPAPLPQAPQPAQQYIPPAAPAPAQPFRPAAYAPPAAAAASAAAGTESGGIFFFYPVLKALNDGVVIRRVVIIALQVVAVLAALGGVLGVVLVLIGGSPGVGAIIASLFMLVGALCAAQVFWYRSGSVRNLEEGGFTVIPVVSILFRMIGEVYLAVGVSVSIGIGIAGLIGGAGAMAGMSSPLGALLPGFGGGGVVGSLISMVAGCIASFFSLVIFYFLAEWTLVVVDIAQHVRTLVKQGETKK
jgi:hypothetical protein